MDGQRSFAGGAIPSPIALLEQHIPQLRNLARALVRGDGDRADAAALATRAAPPEDLYRAPALKGEYFAAGINCPAIESQWSVGCCVLESLSASRSPYRFYIDA